MELMPPTESVFLLGESREHPMHVGGLQLFRKPEGAGPDYLSEVYQEMLGYPDVKRLFRRRPQRPLPALGSWAWAEDSTLDLEYHVRLSALPRPGRVRELLALASRLHGSLLDRHRPLWEMHLVEGLSDDRFAIYSKVHHALADGVTAIRQLRDSLSTDPAERGRPPMWISADGQQGTKSGVGAHPITLARTAASMLGEFTRTAPAGLRVATEVLREHTATLPMQAPKSILNVGIGGARRFAAQSWPGERLRTVSKAARVSVNDVVLAMCSGALRQYLTEQAALPEDPLIAMVPISMRAPSYSARGEVGGNSIGTGLCDLATEEPDPAQRLRRIHESMRRGKQLATELTPLQFLLFSGLVIAPLSWAMIPGVPERTKPPFNLIISNVPGPRSTQYLNGARLEGIYPMSLLLDGQALNITLTSYAGSIEFGVLGCRRSLPSLQRILTHLDTALTDLEQAV
ncbi:WS/DGAT/MGAT family acyltransferase [Tamaricihabitans halophyticus]|uniref:Diacylglycerol O-acyltransferase n=1 Tax=Tamaricihabitans halophyticus TaxID=1262583 RepID=A0A4R2QD08_9PSEU|nr:wax ester/triacylglycerol synthase family O-acyltransferase [Tamaricihabitans halophyticus]TCP46857.1 WS/DGAT/MGAT family acyltransferase [Tamaricihabitans halophyticus]